MELLDYARYRWKVLTLVLLLGLLVIAVVGSGALSNRGQYKASTQLLVRPPTSQLSVFGFNLDRYVTTQIATLYSDSALKAEAKGTPLSPGELRTALSTSRTDGSDVVTLTVQSDNRADAITTVNQVADTYLEQAKAGGRNKEAIAYLQKQAAEQQNDVQSANVQLARALRQAGQGDSSGAASGSLAVDPRAYTRQQLALSALQQTQSQLSQLTTDSQGGSLTRVLDVADSAQPAGDRAGLTAIAAAVVGLLLGLIALTAVALSFSKRVVSPARWDAATANSRLRPAIRGQVGRQRPGDLRRIIVSLTNAGTNGTASVVVFPLDTKRTERTVPDLVSALESARDRNPAGSELVGRADDEIVVMDPHANGGRHTDDMTPIVAVVDLTACRIEDAIVLADADPELLKRIVPVLI